MADIITSTILASGGDYTTVALWEADIPADIVAADEQHVGLLGRNTVESPTIAGITSDATRNVVLRSNRGTNIGRTGLMVHTDVIYGLLTINDVFADVEDIAVVGTAAAAASILLSGSVAVTVNVRRCWCKASATAAGSEHNIRTSNSNAASVLTVESCVAVDSDGGGCLNDGAGTMAVKNTLSYSCMNGIYRATGTVTTRNCHSDEPANAAGDGYTGTITDTTSTSSDGSNGTTTVTPTQWARKSARLSSLRAYGSFDSEPAALPGKIDRACQMRETGSQVGGLSTATISDGWLVGGGNIVYPKQLKRDGVATARVAIRVKVPTSVVTHSVMLFYSTDDSFNRMTLGFLNVGGVQNVFLDTYSNAGVLSSRISYDVTGMEGDIINLAGGYYGGIAYLWLDGAEVSTEVIAITRDATDTMAVLMQPSSAQTIEISHWAVFTGSASAPPSLPMPLYADGLGVLDAFELTLRSSQTLKFGGTVAGAPTLDVQGKVWGSRVAIGPFSTLRQPEDSPMAAQ